MKTNTGKLIRSLSLMLLCLSTIGINSCTKTEDKITPPGHDGAREGKPTGPVTQSYPEGNIYEDDALAGQPIVLKVVGQSSSINEDTDFRLYPTAITCQAYEYLFLRAFAGTTEVGAYITGRGIVIGPNNQGAVGQYRFRTWGSGSANYTAPHLYTTNAWIGITGMIHTHPGGTTTPTTEDRQNLAARFPSVAQYIIANTTQYRFYADGTTTAVASYNDRKCP